MRKKECKSVFIRSKAIKGMVAILGVAGVFVWGSAAQCKVITYPDPEVVLSTDPFGMESSLFTSDSLSNNKVIIEAEGSINGNAYGGVTIDVGKVTGNEITNNGTVGGNIYGGRASTVDVENNILTMNEGSSTHLIGGYSKDGNSLANVVKINGGIVARNVYGGESGSGDTENNKVMMAGGSVNWLLGAYSKSGNVNRNTVEVTGGEIRGGISGGESTTGNVKGNKVNFNNISVDTINGGYSASGNANENEVNIDSGTVNWIQGGSTVTGNVNGNIVTINNGTVTYNAFGGYVNEGTGNASNNVLTLNNGKVGGYIEEYYASCGVYGGRAYSGDTVNNSVNINGGRVGSLTGGYSYEGNVTGNVVTMIDGLAIGSSEAGCSDYGDVVNNTFILKGGTLESSLFGGRTIYGENAVNNTVSISGGIVKNDIYGGHAHSGKATGNIVNLSGDPEFEKTTIYGGYSASGDCFTGNTLNVNNDFEGSIVDVKNFNTYNFSPTALSHNGQTILTLTNSQGTDLSDSTFKVTTEKIAGGSARLKTGDKVNLLYNANGITTSGMDLATPEVNGVQSGITLSYDFVVKAEADRITMEVASIKANPEAIELSDGRAAELNVLTQAAHKVAEIQMDSQDKLTPFMSFDAGHSRYNVGYNPATNSVNGIAGVKMGLLDQILTIAPFIELGYAANKVIDRYESTNQYYGAGVTSKYDIYKGIYAKGAFRIGRSKTDFTSLDLTDVGGERATYKTASTYTGAEIGAGWIHQITENMSIDLYGRYMYSYISENTAEVLEDPIEFSRVNSHRIALGIKVDRKLTSKIDMYCKASFERELSGEINARTYGYQIEPLSMKGNTLGAEAGLSGKTESSLSWNIGIQGYMGQRKGLQGNVALGYLF